MLTRAVISCEGLSGARGFASKVAHSHVWQISASCIQKASVPCHMGLSTELLEWPYNMAASFPQSDNPRERKMKTTTSFMT